MALREILRVVHPCLAASASIPQSKGKKTARGGGGNTHQCVVAFHAHFLPLPSLTRECLESCRAEGKTEELYLSLLAWSFWAVSRSSVGRNWRGGAACSFSEPAFHAWAKCDAPYRQQCMIFHCNCFVQHGGVCGSCVPAELHLCNLTCCSFMSALGIKSLAMGASSSRQIG